MFPYVLKYPRLYLNIFFLCTSAPYMSPYTLIYPHILVTYAYLTPIYPLSLHIFYVPHVPSPSPYDPPIYLYLPLSPPYYPLLLLLSSPLYPISLLYAPSPFFFFPLLFPFLSFLSSLPHIICPLYTLIITL